MRGSISDKVIRRKGYREIHLQLLPERGEKSTALAGRIAEILQARNAQVIRATFFGKLSERSGTLHALGDRLEIDFPCTWIEGDNCTGTFINGVYIFCVSGLEVGRIREGTRIVGSHFETGDAAYCYLGGLYADPGPGPAEQTERLLNSAENLLQKAGFSYGDTIRTWFYLDDILGWYGDFNRARTAFYQHRGIFDQRIPASTGIGGKNPMASRVCLELTAIRPKSGHFTVETVVSPLQCSAVQYGSAFSRALRYSDGEYDTMTVSGTASIDPEGKTMYAGNPLSQIESSFAVVRALLESQGFSFDHVVRAYAYCSDRKNTGVFQNYLETRMQGKFPCIGAVSKICREDLLFEVEVDVVKKKITP